MESRKYIAVTSFGHYIGADPIQFIHGEGRKFLINLMVGGNTPEIERFVKTENVNGKTIVSFCPSLAFEFLNRFNPEFCHFVLRTIGYKWLNISNN